MSVVRALRARLRAFVRRSAADRELRDEIEFHIDTETEKNLRLGMAPDDARRLALAHFGGVERVREEHRGVRRAQWLEDFLADARFAVRTLRRTPTLAGAAVLTLGFGIGANVAIFSAYGDPQILEGSTVTGNFFSTLGVPAALGRTLSDGESWANGTHVVVLSDRGWRDKFGADPSIVGIMPPGFAFPQEGVDVWRSVEWDKAARGDIGFRRAHWLRAVARLAPGATEAHANAQLQAVVDRLRREYPETNKMMGAAMMPLHDFLIGDTRLPLLVLLASVVFLLLIA
jgi:hypothetical protein